MGLCFDLAERMIPDTGERPRFILVEQYPGHTSISSTWRLQYPTTRGAVAVHLATAEWRLIW